jgi:hypothetical protein
MTLEQLVHNVESRLLGLGRLFLQPDPRTRWQEEIDELSEELHQRRLALARAVEERDIARRRLSDNQTAAVLLPSQIESCIRQGRADQAWRHALELDEVRQTLAQDRDALPRLDQTCWSLDFLIRQFERRLARLRDRPPQRG